MSRYVVTGGAGFIGSHLCERLLREGHNVVCVDNLVTGSLLNVQPLRGHSRFEFAFADVAASLVVPGKVDGIFHLASPASPVDYLELPLETLRTGSLGSFAALELAREKGCPILLTSTSEVYGDPEQHPQRESYFGNVNPIGPRSVYDEAKRFMEACAMAYQRKYGLSVRLARIFNTYGPRMHPADGRVVSNFIMQALKDEPISIYGDGSQTRSFCYVDDLIRGLIALMETGPETTGPINIGNPNEFTVRQLAEKVIELTGSRSQIVQEPLPQDDPKQRQPDISKAKRDLGWEPSVQLDEGLAKTIDYFRRFV